MSLIVGQYGNGKLYIAADTCVYQVKGNDESRMQPERKLHIFRKDRSFCVVARAGDKEIDGTDVFTLVTENKSLLFMDSGVPELAKILNDRWCNDIESYKWDNYEEKSNYVASARISLMIADSDKRIHSIDGDYKSGLKYCKHDELRNVAIGMTFCVRKFLCQSVRHEDRCFRSFIRDLFTAGSSCCKYIDFPIDYLKWDEESEPSIQRFDAPHFDDYCQQNEGGNSE